HVNCQSTNRCLINRNIILRCLVQNLTEDAILTCTMECHFIISEWNTRILLRILTNTQQLPDQIDMRLVSLVFDYLHVFMHIMENDNQSK
ncbi:unnamed protein product, partial [Rotaria sp. Silwood1]